MEKMTKQTNNININNMRCPAPNPPQSQMYKHNPIHSITNK